MITRDSLRLFVILEHGLKQVRSLGARETGELAIMGAAKGADELRRVLEVGTIDHYIISSGDPFLGSFRAEAFKMSPKAMVERLEEALRSSETLPSHITVCSSLMRTREGLEAINGWFKSQQTLA